MSEENKPNQEIHVEGSGSIVEERAEIVKNQEVREKRHAILFFSRIHGTFRVENKLSLEIDMVIS